MATETVLERENQGTNRKLKDQIVSKIVEMGCACPTDLAGQMGSGLKPSDLLDPLDSLVKSGILRRKDTKNDTRKYNKYQVVYELAR